MTDTHGENHLRKVSSFLKSASARRQFLVFGWTLRLELCQPPCWCVSRSLQSVAGCQRVLHFSGPRDGPLSPCPCVVRGMSQKTSGEEWVWEIRWTWYGSYWKNRIHILFLWFTGRVNLGKCPDLSDSAASLKQEKWCDQSYRVETKRKRHKEAGISKYSVNGRYFWYQFINCSVCAKYYANC